ncbi:MAG TPA: DUF4245 domain-containing protein [Galbitalea sp.]
MSLQNDRSKPARIVAELGRPETPDETAARKAENSRAHRANQTTRNLILALLASLAIVLCTVLVVIRPNNTAPTTVDYKTVAAQAQSGIKPTLVAPELPKGWRANDAQLKQEDENAQTWYIGLLTPKQQFVAVEEGVGTTDAFFGSLLGKAQPTGAATIDGIRWTVYNQRGAANPGNFGYSLTATVDGARYVLHGSADNAEFRELAGSIAADLDAANQN